MSETRKSIKFNVLLDTSEVPQALKAMQRQMEQSQTSSRMAQQGMGGIIPKPEDVQKSKTALMQFIREQAQQQEKLYGLVNKQAEKVSMLNSYAKDNLKTEKEKEAILNRQIAAKQRLEGLEKAYDSRQKVLSQALDMSGGKNNGPTINESLTGAAKKFVIPAVIAAVVGATAKAITSYAALPREITTATGAATQGLIGTPLQNMQTDMIKSMAFKKEWGESLAMASKERERANFMGAARLTSVNGMVGRLGGDASDIMDFISPGSGSATIGRITKPFEQAYQSQQGQTEMERAQQEYTAKIQSDPLKMAAVNKFSQNYMRDLQSQRMMGLSDQGYFGAGGFQERMNKGGFNEELGLGMAGQIQGAGGSTRAMSGLAQTGLQAQRGFDLTNAGSVLGRISSSAGGDKSSEQIFRKLMEEAIKSGLDKSEFREEQRRFADAASDILSNSGVKTAADAAQVLSGFSKFMGGEPTVKGIEGAKGAFEQFQGISSQTSGRMGALKMASFMQNPKLRKLGTAGIGELMQLPDKDIIASNPEIMAAAKEGGYKSPQDLVDDLRSGDRGAMLSAMNLNGGEVNAFASSSEGQAFRNSGGRDVDRLSAKNLKLWRRIQSQSPFLFSYKSPQEQNAANLGILGGEGGGVGDEYARGMAGGTGRMGDVSVASSGQVSQELLENFREFSKAITPSTEAVAEWTKQLMLSATVLRYTAAGNQAAAIKAMADSNSSNAIKGGQPQVTTPNPE